MIFEARNTEDTNIRMKQIEKEKSNLMRTLCETLYATYLKQIQSFLVLIIGNRIGQFKL